MADERGPGGPLPVSALILVPAAFGILGLPKTPLKSDRPAITRLHKAPPYEDVRALFMSYVYYKGMRILFSEFHSGHLLIRGELSYEIYRWTGYFTRWLFFVIMFFAFDQAQNCSRMIRLFSEYVENAEKAPAIKFVSDARSMSQIIVRRTECVTRLVLVPFFIWFLLILSRLHFFEAWDPSWLQGFARGVAAVICIFSALILHRSAKRFQEALLDALDQRLRKSGPTYFPYYSKELTSTRKDIAELRRGAFSPIYKLPIVQAVLWPFTGLGGVFVIQ